MRRREFIGFLGGVAATWPLRAGAQQAAVRRVGVLLAFDDPASGGFQQELGRLGWSEDRNIHFDVRYAPAAADARTFAKELIALQPDVIFVQSRPITAVLHQETQSIPIVFTFVIDPIGAGFVQSFPHPGGNITGFIVFEPSIIGKWLAMLKEIAPKTKHVAFLGNPKSAPYFDYLLHAGEDAARQLDLEVTPAPIANDPTDVERAIASIASVPNSSMAVLPDGTTAIQRGLIVSLAARYKVPAIYNARFFVTAGGLMCYGVIYKDQYKLAAGYVDRILRGAKSTDLPVQSPNTYETVLNLKASKALGIDVPAGLLVAADEVIE